MTPSSQGDSGTHHGATPLTKKEQQQELAEDNNPLYKQDQFRMYCLKVLPCSKRYCHDWTTCPFAHPAEKAKRRDPRMFTYTGVACPEMKKNMRCLAGDKCSYAHSVFEYWLHPSRYRTQLCNDGVSCKRKICFFAHTLEELRVSSVKVLNPEMARMGETFELDPFASGTSESGRGGGPGFSTNISNGGGLGRPHGGGSAGANHGGGCNNNSAAAAQQAPGFSMADMQQLTQLHAKLQAASGMGTLGALQSQLQQQQRMGGGGAAGGADPAAMEQLMHQLAQQQPHQHMDLMHVMSQVLANQQHHHQQATAAAVAAATVQAGHNPMAAHLQLLQNGGMPNMGGGADGHSAMEHMAIAGLNVAGMPIMPGHPLPHLLQQQQHAHLAAMAVPRPFGAGIIGMPGGMGPGGGLIMGPQGLHRQHGVHVHDPLHHGNSNGGGMHANMGGGRHGMVARGSPAGGVNRGSGPSLAADSQQQEALLAQQFAGLAATGTAPPPPPPPFHLHSQLSNGSSSSHATAQHGGGRMQVNGGNRIQQQSSLPPPHAPVPITANRRACSLQYPNSHQQPITDQLTRHASLSHTMGFARPSVDSTMSPALSLPSHAIRPSGSGSGTPVLDVALSQAPSGNEPYSSNSSSNNSAAMAAAAATTASTLATSSGSPPLQLHSSGSGSTAAQGATLFSNNISLSRTTSSGSAGAAHVNEGGNAGAGTVEDSNGPSTATTAG